jgi:hypothetical protein
MLPLPPEIFDKIFSFLHSDPGTLKASREAYPVLSGIIDPHFYAHITVHNLNSINQHSFHAPDLLKLLSDDAHIAKYVRSLQIVINWPVVVPRRNSTWCSFKDDEIVPILTLLPRLESLILWSRGVRWNLLQESFRTAFSNCLRLLSVKEASVQGFQDFPLSTFNSCKSLRYLSLDGKFEFTNQSGNPPRSNKSPYPRLESLSIHNCPKPALTNIIAWVNTSGLRFLDFRFARLDEFKMLPQLLHARSASLTSLELGFGRDCKRLITNSFSKPLLSPHPTVQKTNDPFDSGSYVDLSAFPLLEDITIHVSLCSSPVISRSLNNSSLPGLTELLQSVPFSSVKRLILHFHFYLNGTVLFAQMDFSHLSLLPQLHTVHPIVLRISVVQNYVNLSVAKILPSIESNVHLMEMVRQGVLIISVEDSGSRGPRRGVISHKVSSPGSSPRVLL